MRTSLITVLALLPAILGCSCKSGGSARPDGGVGDAAQADAPQRDVAPHVDAWQRPDGGVASLDVPWGPDETRQLQPIEIPWAVAEADCGTACTQVTFLPGAPGDGGENTYNVSGALLATNTLWQQRHVAVFVDLPSRRAFAFGLIRPDLPYQDTSCLFTVVDQGRIVYSCSWGLDSGEFYSETRLFYPATGLERRLWKLPPGAPLDNPRGFGFLGDQLEMMRTDRCQACGAIFVGPVAGGPGTQVFPAAGQEGGIDEVHASDHYIVWSDYDHFSPQYQVAFLDISGSAPAAPVTGASGDRFGARVKGSRVAWMDTRNDPTHGAYNPQNTDIYARDLATSEEWAACTDVARQENPDVEGDIVVWTDFRNSDTPYPVNIATHADIYAANVRTGQEWRVTDLPGLAYDVRIDGGRVFFFYTPTVGIPPQVYMVDLAARGILVRAPAPSNAAVPGTSPAAPRQPVR